MCAMTELIGTVSLQKHTLLGFTMRNNNWARFLTDDYECLEHMNVFVTSEENFIISSKRYLRNKMSQTDKWKGRY